MPVIPTESQIGDIRMNNNFVQKNKILLMLYCSRPSKLIMAGLLSKNMSISINTVQTPTYVTNLKLTDNWRGTTTQFLLHFKEQLWLLDSLVLMDEQLPDSTRIHSCRELWKVFLTSEESGSLMEFTENVAKDTSKGSLVDCQEDVPYTALTIV